MEGFLGVGFFALGLVVASFVGVVAERVHTGQSFLKGRSRCNSCSVPLRPHELLPVFSWFISLGRCRTCSARVPFQYVVYELVLGFLFALAFFSIGLTSALPVLLAFLAVLFFIVLYDIRHTVVPEYASLTLVVLSCVFGVLSSNTLASFGFDLFVSGVITVAFLLLHVLSKGKAMGLGDVPVVFALSLVVSGQTIPGLLFSFWIGALYGIVVLLLRRGGPTMGIEVPFVPFLAIGFLLAYFTGWNPSPL